MKKASPLSGKRFLICQPMIRSFCGSTVVTLELANYLKSIGAEVLVYTSIALEPASRAFRSSGIEVVTSEEKFEKKLNDFDYIWIHSLTFPRQLMDDFKYHHKDWPTFIFLHMSPLDTIPDEHPWIYNFENSLSSLSLYISEKTLDSNKKYLLPGKTGYYRNPAPVAFRNLSSNRRSTEFKNVLIVSNHPPEEIIGARKILERKGVKVDIYGEGQDEYKTITPETLSKYSAVITIGKTVQYCLVGSVPVYIYDWYGGPGWLTEDNYKHSKENNFSGRFSEKKTSEQIASEVMDGYSSAVDFYSDLPEKEKDEFSIDHVLTGIFKNLKARKIGSLSEAYIESVKDSLYCHELRFIANERLAVVSCERDELFLNNNKLKTDNCELSVFKDEYFNLINSKRYKLLNNILKPSDIIRKVFKNTKNN